ncbi:MAG: DUF4129 domain-containing protein, partial [Actinomycetota bacterium]|nr:DUF4129 domain-containing protein [Actinomycetota bacterium]
RIHTVDGRAVDHDVAFGNVTGPELERRLESLADAEPADPGGAAGGGVDADLARRRAEEILGQTKFEERDIPRPFKGVLDAIGRGLERAGDWLYELADDITGGNPRWLLWALLVAAAVLGAFVARRLIRRRVKRARELQLDLAGDEGLDPDELEARADEAERGGRLEEAIRLRFRAGLIRLSRAQVIPAQPSLTSGDVARYLRSRTYEEVAATFDEVVYGRRDPHPQDVERTRTGWREVLDEVRGRAREGARRT